LGTPYQGVADGKPFQTLGIVANKDWADKNPALSKKLAGVLRQTAVWANKNHGEAASLLAQLTKIPFDVIASIPRLEFAESNNPALVQPVIELLVHYGIMSQSFPAAQLFAPGVS
jgi:ABC-type nitrate/sulfonate/bicarbonate transport system substrate-binding protein